MSADVNPAESECAACLCLASRQLAQALTRLYERYLRPHCIHVTQFTALAVLSSGPATIGELAKIIGIERTTLSRNLVRLDAQGWVKIKGKASDARLRIVALTREGRAKFAATLPAWRRAQLAAVSAFGDGAAKVLHDLASKSTG